jgi:hypothetical protein
MLSIFSEQKFMEKVNYIHQNPVKAGLVERAVDYRWSSAPNMEWVSVGR